MGEYYAEEFELPLAVAQTPAISIHTKEATRTTSTPISILNEDCLSLIFHHLAIEPLDNPPKFERNSGVSFLSISCPRYQNQQLLLCCLVSKRWYPIARKALHYRLVMRVAERDAWYARLEEMANGEGRYWVQSVVLVGGGNKKSSVSAASRIWELMPNLKEVEIFGQGWATGSFLCTEGLARAGQVGGLHGIRRLDVTGTSEYLLSDLPLGSNFLDIQKLLGFLPNLHTLALRGFTYRLPLPLDLDIPPFELKELELEKCNMSLDAFRWIVSGSCRSLEILEIPSTSIWRERDGTTVPPPLNAEDEVEVMTQRLRVSLPLFSIMRKVELS